MNKRIVWKDVFCGLGIILIYLGHLGNTGVGNIRPFIGLFANPIFFCSGGFFIHSSMEKRSFSKWLVFNVDSLLIPYLGWSLINTFFYSILSGSDLYETLSVLKSYILCDFKYFQFAGTVWFLNGLFVCRIFYYLLNRILKHKFFILLFFLIFDLLYLWFYKSQPSNGYVRGIFYGIWLCLGDIFYPHLEKVHTIICQDQSLNINKLKIILLEVLLLGIGIWAWFEQYKLLYRYMNIYYVLIFQQLILPFFLTTMLLIGCMFFQTSFLTSIGGNTIILCGSEGILKALGAAMINIFGADSTKALQNPIICYIYIFGIIAFANRYIFKEINTYFPALCGKGKTLEPREKKSL